MVKIKSGGLVLAASAMLSACASTEPFAPCVCPAPKIETVEVKVQVPIPCIDAKDIEPLPVLSVTQLAQGDAAQPGMVAQRWNVDLIALMSLAQRQRNLLLSCAKAAPAPQ